MEAKSLQENQKFSLGSTVSASNLGEWKETGVALGWSHWFPYESPAHYHLTTWPVVKESRFDIAFKIVAKLIETGTVKEMSVKKFIQLVKEIADEL